MSPDKYVDHLDTGSLREGLPVSELRPCSAADITSFEREMGMSLPDQYVDFLCRVGAGDEFGGLARWFHLDLTRPGNIITRSAALVAEQARLLQAAGAPVGQLPDDILFFYDPHDGALYGFLPASDSDSDAEYQPAVFLWDCEEFSLEEVSSNLFGFLSYLCEEAPASAPALITA